MSGVPRWLARQPFPFLPRREIQMSAPNQREIAAILGISQAAVSMALRGNRKVSAEIRQKVHETAARLGYHSNAYVNVLMSRIRSGKKISDKGVIAMLVDSPSREKWLLVETYRKFYDGVLRRGKELGFEVVVLHGPLHHRAIEPLLAEDRRWRRSVH